MFLKGTKDGYKPVLDNIEMKTLAYGEKTTLVEFRMKKGAHLPSHNHPHEQTGYLISGCIELTIGEEIFTVKQGDSWCITGETMHHANVLEDTTAIEVFSPAREDYLPEVKT